MSLYIVGMGPGSLKGMTLEAKEALERCSLIAGYTVYTDLVKAHYPEKEYYSTPMRREEERCRYVLERAADGLDVALVCSGDAGIYGMAGLVFQLREETAEAGEIEIRVIPGVTAASSGAALLGAPLTNDFAVISLSDLLTPLETIQNRLRCAAMGDMVICLYNPSSKKRGEYLKMACDIVLEYRSPETVCGYVKNIGREGEEKKILTLKELRETQADMFTTVYIGCKMTREISGRMVTPRGYRLHRDEKQASAVKKEGAGEVGRIWIFGGTTEGRLLYRHCLEKEIPAVVHVATSYGGQILEQEKEACGNGENGDGREEAGRMDATKQETVVIREGRLTKEKMREVMERERPVFVLDATHPHAAEVSENIRAVCGMLGIPCRRVVRDVAWEDEKRKEAEENPCFDTVQKAVAFLQEKTGNILVTTGSRELHRYTLLRDYRERLYVRILPDAETIRRCTDMGIRGRHLLAMQGPFSEEMNRAVIKEYDIRWLVTKLSGGPGGFLEKQRAAKETGAELIVIRKRERETGIGIEEAKEILEEWK